MDYRLYEFERELQLLHNQYKRECEPLIQRMIFIAEVSPTSIICEWDPDNEQYNCKSSEHSELIKIRKSLQNIWEHDYLPKIQDLKDSYYRGMQR